MTALDIIILAISVPLWLFQISLLNVLIFAGSKTVKEYRSGFYIVFIVLGVTDSIYFFIKLLGNYMIDYGIFTEFFQSQPGVIFIIFVSKFSPFCLNFEYFAHCLLSFNRFTTFCWTSLHKKIWNGISIIIIICLMYILTFISVSHRVFSLAVVDLNRGLVASYDSQAAAVSVLSGLIVVGITSFLELIFELLTCFKLFTLRKSTQNKLFKNKQEIRLFVYALIFFVMHLILTIYYIINYLYSLKLISKEIYDASRPVVDVTRALFTNSNSLLLFLLSGFVRKNYFKYYKINVGTSSSTITTSQFT